MIGTHQVHRMTTDDNMYEHHHQQQYPAQTILQNSSPGGAQILNRESAYGSPTSFMITHASQSFTSSVHPSHNATQVHKAQRGAGYSQTHYSRLPSPPPLPPRLLRYGNSKALHQSSSPSFEKDKHLLHVKHSEHEHHHLNSDLGRGRFEEGHIPSELTDGERVLMTGQVTSQDETSHGWKYPSQDSRPGSEYPQAQGLLSQTAIGIPVTLSASVEMPNSLYTGHLAGMSGGLMLGVASNQTKVQVLARPRGSSSKWRPN